MLKYMMQHYQVKERTIGRNLFKTSFVYFGPLLFRMSLSKNGSMPVRSFIPKSKRCMRNSPLPQPTSRIRLFGFRPSPTRDANFLSSNGLNRFNIFPVFHVHTAVLHLVSLSGFVLFLYANFLFQQFPIHLI